MKAKNLFSLVVVIMIAMIGLMGCHKDPIFTPRSAAEVTTGPVISISDTSAVVGGEVISSGSYEVSDRGIYFSLNDSLTNNGKIISAGTGLGNFTCSLDSLNYNTHYYYRAYATTSMGTSYGEVLSFTTNNCPVVILKVITASARNITETRATVGGNITNSYGQNISDRGIYFSLEDSVSDKDIKVSTETGLSKFTCFLSDLNSNTTYYYLAYATNSLGTSYGEILSFKTKSRPAELNINGYSDLGLNKVNIKTEVIPNNSNITEYGVCFNSNTNPTISDNRVVSQSESGEITISVTNLESNTKYYFRAYAITDEETIYSSEIKIWTYAVMDIDGNGYHSVKIGNQIWLRENLKVEHYNDGSEIANVTDNTAWSNLSTGAYCYYNNDRKYKDIYGALYNFFAVDTKKLAPDGWHVSSDEEWTTMRKFLGCWPIINDQLGGILKETGTAHWQAPNTGASDDYGFCALPTGDRNRFGEFDDLTTLGYFLSSTSAFGDSFWTKKLFYNKARLQDNGASYQKVGDAVRCVKN